MDRSDFFYRQRVTEGEMDEAFDYAEIAEWNIKRDHQLQGVLKNADVTEQSPTPDLTVKVSGPGVVHDQFGKRIEWTPDQNVDCSVDENSLPTAVGTPGNEKWLSIFAEFDRELSDPRTDGNGVTVYYGRSESFKINVVQGAEAGVGLAVRPSLRPDQILLCDILLAHGDTQIFDSAIDITRRQDLIVASHGIFDIRSNSIPDAISDLLAVLDIHHSSGGHPASAIDFTPYSWIAATDVQAALEEVVDDLALQTVGVSGARRIGYEGYAAGWHDSDPLAANSVKDTFQTIVQQLSSETGNGGADKIGVAAIADSPYSLTSGSIFDQMAEMLSSLNDHVSETSGAHASTAISGAITATWHNGNPLTGTNVDAIQEQIVTDLADDSGDTLCGSDRIGSEAYLPASTYHMNQGSVRDQLKEFLDNLNDHTKGISGQHEDSQILTTISAQWANSESLAATTAHEAFEEIVGDLADTTAPAGGNRIGTPTQSSSPFSLSTTTVTTQLAELLGHINSHVGGTGQHDAADVTFSPYSYLTSTDVQAAIQEFVDRLADTGTNSGGDRIGCEAQSSTNAYFDVSSGTLTSQILEILNDLDGHQLLGKHDTLRVLKGTAGERDRVNRWGDDPDAVGAAISLYKYNGDVGVDSGLAWVKNLEWDEVNDDWDRVAASVDGFIMLAEPDRWGWGFYDGTTTDQSDDQLLDFTIEENSVTDVGTVTGPYTYTGLWRYSAGERGAFTADAINWSASPTTVTRYFSINWKIAHKSISSLSLVDIAQNSNWNTGSHSITYINEVGAWGNTATASIGAGASAWIHIQYVTA